jgi:hypothetical protein
MQKGEVALKREMQVVSCFCRAAALLSLPSAPIAISNSKYLLMVDLVMFANYRLCDPLKCWLGLRGVS